MPNHILPARDSAPIPGSQMGNLRARYHATTKNHSTLLFSIHCNKPYWRPVDWQLLSWPTNNLPGHSPKKYGRVILVQLPLADSWKFWCLESFDVGARIDWR